MLTSVPTYSSHDYHSRGIVERKLLTTRAESGAHAVALSLARLGQAAKPALTAEEGR